MTWPQSSGDDMAAITSHHRIRFQLGKASQQFGSYELRNIRTASLCRSSVHSMLLCILLALSCFRTTSSYLIAPNTSFILPPCGDSVEFQSIALEDSACGNPIFIFSDRIDPNSFFVGCDTRAIRVKTMVASSETTSAGSRPRIGNEYVQLTPHDPELTLTALAQAADPMGTVLAGLSSSWTNLNSFGLFDRMGINEPQYLWTDSKSSVLNIATFAHDPTSVFWLRMTLAFPQPQHNVILTRVNYSSPNASIEIALPFGNLYSTPHATLVAHPRMPILYIVEMYNIIEYNTTDNTSRVLFTSAGFAFGQFTHLTFPDSDNVIFASLGYYTIPDKPASDASFVVRIHRDTAVSETMLRADQCAGAQGVSHLLFITSQQTLFIGCEVGLLLSASFNGTVSDSSSSTMIHVVTNPTRCSMNGLIMLPSSRLVLFCTAVENEEASQVTQSASVSETRGVSLAATVSQVQCFTPVVISAQHDEYLRRLLLHECRSSYPPVVVVDGATKVLTNLCAEGDAFVHRDGTSEIYARCKTATINRLYYLTLTAVQADNTNGRTLFTCPEPMSSGFGAHSGTLDTMLAQVSIARNDSVLIVCFRSVWLVPIEPSAGSIPQMLLNFTDEATVGENVVNYIDGMLSNSKVVTVCVEDVNNTVAEGRRVYVAPLDNPKLFWVRKAGNVQLDEENNSLFYDVLDPTRNVVRQDVNADGSPAGSFLLFNSSTRIIRWQVEPFTRQLIVIRPQSQIWIVDDAYAHTNYSTPRPFMIIAGCLDFDPLDLLTSVGSPYLTLHRRLRMMLFTCNFAAGPDWLLIGLSLESLRNSSAPIVWTPFLRATTSCNRLTEKPWLAPGDMEFFLHCNGVAQVLTDGFQCAAGQSWINGQCRDCLSGTSKPVWNSTNNDNLLFNPHCVSCTPGSIAVAPATFTCTTCPVGTAHDVSLGEVCRPCSAGRFSNYTGMSECLTCADGTVQPSLGSSTCTACILGSLADSNAVTCIPCARGWYTPTNGADAVCVSCEGPHQQGLNCSDGVASVQEGYFAFLVPDPSYGKSVYHTAICPATLCPGSPLQIVENNPSRSKQSAASGGALWSNCPDTDSVISSGIDFCCWPRLNSADNLLCAHCSDGFLPWGSTCVKCIGPNGGLIFGMFLFTVVLVWWLFSNTAQADVTVTVTSTHFSRSTDTSGHVALLLYFVQISALQLGRASDWLQWMHYSNLSAQSSRDCIAPLDAYQQTAFNLAVPFILIGILALLGSAHLLFDRCCRRGGGRRNVDESFTAAEVQLQMELNSDRQRPLMMMDNDSMQSMGSFNADLSQSFASATTPSPWTPLYGCYQSDAWYWNSMVLLRRMLFAVSAVFLSTDNTGRNTVFGLLHFVSLLLQQFVVPYRQPMLNQAEVASYFILFLQAVLLQLRTPPYPVWFEVCILSVTLLPVLALVAWMAHIKIGGRSNQRSGQSMCRLLWSRIITLLTPPSFSLYRYKATILSLLLFCYTAVTTTVFTFLRCVVLTDDISLVLQTPTMQCGSERYKRYEVWVLLVLSLYVIGFPLACLVLLARKRHKQDAPQSAVL